MRDLTKDQKAAAREVFESNPQIEAVYVCEDGQCFERENSGYEHQKEALKKQQLSDEELPVLVKRDEIESAEAKPKAPTAASLIELIGAAETAEEIDSIVGEDQRATVLKAAETRKLALGNA